MVKFGKFLTSLASIVSKHYLAKYHTIEMRFRSDGPIISISEIQYFIFLNIDGLFCMFFTYVFFSSFNSINNIRNIQ